MDNLKDFIIPFRGLSLGVHKYDWEIGKKFFESIENTEIQDANITVSLELEKQERLMILNFLIEGEMVVLCDRCLDDLKLTITTKETFYVKIGAVEMGMEEAENILVIPETEYKIDIGLLVNEFITLSLPLKKVHGEDENGISECNPEALKKLEELSAKNKIDPRWDKLKNIKLD
ncbi:MAG: DUF177 domain-containing protein [Bacteroidales bacterium]|nr:DUF177 domain-containing protein [Bacteroidales bacterium]